MDTGDKNCYVTAQKFSRELGMSSEESLGKIKVKHVKLLLNGAVHKFYRLKGTSEYLVSVVERGKMLVNKTLIVRITGLVLLIFTVHKNESRDEHAVYFGRLLKSRSIVYHVFSLWQ